MLYFRFLILIIQVRTATELLRIHDELVALSVDFGYHLILDLRTVGLRGACPVAGCVLPT